MFSSNAIAFVTCHEKFNFAVNDALKAREGCISDCDQYCWSNCDLCNLECNIIFNQSIDNASTALIRCCCYTSSGFCPNFPC